MQQAETRIGAPSNQEYRALVQRLYSGPLKEPLQLDWSQEQVERLVEGVRTNFGKAFLASEAGCSLEPIRNNYLSRDFERRSFLGFAVMQKDADLRRPTIPQPFHNQEQLRAKSIANDPSGMGLTSDVYPLELPGMYFMLKRKDIPSHPETVQLEQFNNQMHQHLREQVVVLITVIQTKYETAAASWFRGFSNKHQKLLSILEFAQLCLRRIDDVHTWADEWCANKMMGRTNNVLSVEEVQKFYKELQKHLVTVQDSTDEL